ncbi:hypothetical protein GCM10009789_22840 [Kribbella sancticallisti]|uniref:Uncharacterized protein n=1 Tax=Kribbella sancticallisti TaxID=460087 RepID=A0ABP4NVW4_9ACTN
MVPADRARLISPVLLLHPELPSDHARFRSTLPVRVVPGRQPKPVAAEFPDLAGLLTDMAGTNAVVPCSSNEPTQLMTTFWTAAVVIGW